MYTNQYIYIVGKSDPGSATIQAIRQAGYKVGLFSDTQLSARGLDRFGNVYPLDFSRLEDELRPELRMLPIAGLICTYENYVTPKAVIAAYLGVPSPTVAAARHSTDKNLMRQAFTAYDPAITPAFQIVTKVQDALTFGDKHGYPVIIKPTNLVKSLLVLRCDTPTELERNVAYAQVHISDLYTRNHIYDRQPQLIIEQFVTGRQCSVAAFVDHQGVPHLCGGTVGLVSANEAGYDDGFLYKRMLPINLDRTLERRIRETAVSAVYALGLTSTPAHIELIYTADGSVQVIEVGARIGGYRPRMYRLSYGIDLNQQEVALALGQTPQLRGKFKAYSAVYELFPTHRGKFFHVTGAQQSNDFTYYREQAKVGNDVGPAREGFRASAIIMISHEDLETFQKLCTKAESMVVQVTT